MRPVHPALPRPQSAPDWFAGAAPAAGQPPRADSAPAPFALGPSPLEALRREHAARGARIRRSVRRLFRPAIAGLGVALLVRLFVVETFPATDAAMEPAIRAGDTLVVDKTAYGWSVASLPGPLLRLWATRLSVGEAAPGAGARLLARPAARGDTVAFAGGPSGTAPVIARVIGLAGDRVAIRAGRVWLNGTVLACAPVGGALCRERIDGAGWLVRPGPGDTEMAEVTVANGQLFLMGDNRAGTGAGLVRGKVEGERLVAETRLIGRVGRVGGPEGWMGMTR